MAERRSAGEGSIYRLPNGKWQGALDVGWVDGRRVRSRITRKTRREVFVGLRELTALSERSQLSSERPPTLSVWLDTYLDEVAGTRVRPHPGELSLAQRNPHEPVLGRYRIDQLRPQHIAAFYKDLSQTLSPASIRRIHAVLRRALTVAVRWG